MSFSDLFRKEALNHQRERLLGDVIILQPLSVTVMTVIICILVAFTAFYLIWGEYTRKEIVRGYVVPDKGLIKLYAPRSGTVEQVYIKDGEHVKPGAALFSVLSKRYSGDEEDIDTMLLGEMEQQRKELEAQKQRETFLFENEKIKLQSSISHSAAQLKVLIAQEAIQQERLHLNQKNYQELATLYQDGHIAKRDLDNQAEQLLALKNDLQALKAQIVLIRGRNKQLGLELDELPMQQKNNAIQLDSQISEVIQKITEVTGRRQFTVYAPASGMITALQVMAGETVLPDRPLVTILPEGANMEVHLLVPTRAIGFIKKGQQTRLRYSAFPYQRFGIYLGYVKEINKSILMPNEINTLLTLNEPVYKVIVELEFQHIQAYGKKFNLQSGMQLEADIVIESRSLWNWLLDPIYSIKGKA